MAINQTETNRIFKSSTSTAESKETLPTNELQSSVQRKIETPTTSNVDTFDAVIQNDSNISAKDRHIEKKENNFVYQISDDILTTTPVAVMSDDTSSCHTDARNCVKI